MRYSLKKIIHDTRLFLDLNHDAPPLVETLHDGNLSIDDIIRSKVETAARQVAQRLDNLLLAPGKPIRASLAWPEGVPGYGMAVLPLPDDCLRLLTVRLTDWRRPAHIITENDPEYRWQHTPWPGVGGNPSRPVAAICQRPTGMVAELYSSDGGRDVAIAVAQYYPVPHVTADGTVDIPSLAYDDVIRQVAMLTAETIGYANETTKAII
ncbi:MAG: hypothetical protein J5529_05420 [Prevotella sp.]|nr:hypothetical protein [Prevotella sp.]